MKSLFFWVGVGLLVLACARPQYGFGALVMGIMFIVVSFYSNNSRLT